MNVERLLRIQPLHFFEPSRKRHPKLAFPYCSLLQNTRITINVVWSRKIYERDAEARGTIADITMFTIADNGNDLCIKNSLLRSFNKVLESRTSSVFCARRKNNEFRTHVIPQPQQRRRVRASARASVHIRGLSDTLREALIRLLPRASLSK